MKKTNTTKKEQPEIIEKGWGSEVIFANNEMYCGKLLRFNKGARFSMHFHMKKDETWYLAEGTIRLNWIDTTDASKKQEVLRAGDVIRNRPGEPHQVEALSDAVIFEVSTTHFDEDSYRVERGDSQVV
jgi:mannose-6-phosphate isomerase-like protein (cupin superfamily)|tara:strand:+ start:6596 stop:6979 length:384 start_codon:yes stop_codon:yes gene_type:complete